jgi:hypothetical protein
MLQYGRSGTVNADATLFIASFYHIKNTFGPNAGMTTNDLGRIILLTIVTSNLHSQLKGLFTVSFIIFWVVSLPIFLLRPEQ